MVAMFTCMMKRAIGDGGMSESESSSDDDDDSKAPPHPTVLEVTTVSSCAPGERTRPLWDDRWPLFTVDQIGPLWLPMCPSLYDDDFDKMASMVPLWLYKRVRQLL